MLSPEAELRGIVRAIQEPASVDGPDYISLRRVRSIVAQTIRATRELAQLEHALAYGDQDRADSSSAASTLDLALVDLDRTSDPYKG